MRYASLPLATFLVLGVAGAPAQAKGHGASPTINAIYPFDHLDTLVVTIKGDHLRHATKVTIGDTAVPFVVRGADLVATPTDSHLQGPVKVTTAEGSATSEDWVEPPPFFGAEGAD